MPAIRRLRKEKDFERIFKKGKGFKEDFLALKTVGSSLKVSRFGFIVSQKVSKKATVRNKIRRRLSELIRTWLGKIIPGREVLFIVLPGFEKKDFRETEELLDKLLKKANLIR